MRHFPKCFMLPYHPRKRVLPSLEDSPYVTLDGLQLDDEETELSSSTRGGNWGNKSQAGARWVRKGKLAAWSPSKDDWEVEERARKRIKRMLPSVPRSPSPPRLSHVRSPSPPLVAPYPPPITQHLSFTSFILDPAAQHSFRSGMLSDLERATGGLIEGEAALRRALGRLWEVLSDDADDRPSSHAEKARSATVPKQEETEGENTYSSRGDESGDEDGRTTAPEMAINLHKIFIPTPATGHSPRIVHGMSSFYESNGMSLSQQQEDMLDKALATLRELQEDGREYVERLEEIREGLGAVRSQRSGLWTVVRERALKEMEEGEL